MLDLLYLLELLLHLLTYLLAKQEMPYMLDLLLYLGKRLHAIPADGVSAEDEAEEANLDLSGRGDEGCL